jgi:cell division protein FtsL
MENRNRYIYGSAAPQMPVRQEEKQPVRREQPKKAVPVAAPKYAHVPKAKLFFAILAMFSICFVILYRFSALAEMNYQMGVMTKEYDKLRDENRKLKVEIETSINLSNVEKLAMEKLGMHKPDKSQLVPVSIPKNNYSVVLNEQYIQNAGSTGGSFIENALNALQAAFP